MSERRFFGRLFDLSFSRFIATSLIKLVYVLAMIAGILGAIAFSVQCFAKGDPMPGPVSLLVSPLGLLAYLIVVRVYCEFLIVIFAIAEDLEDIRGGIKRLSEPGSAPK